MKHLMIRNKGVLNLDLLRLIGASTKTDDPSKIGQFGTGLKYAISYLVRNENKFHLFTGEKEVKFTTSKIGVNGQDWQEVKCDGVAMNITTQYGYQWNAWEVIREIYCNAMDESSIEKKVVDGRAKKKGKPGYTTFYIEVDEEVAKVIEHWNSYFNARSPIFENDEIAIFNKKEPSKLKIYKNGVLVENHKFYKSYFDYDFKTCELNELRQYRGFANDDIATAILNSNEKVVKEFLRMYNDSSVTNVIEKGSLYFESARYNADRLLKIFQGYLFLHPKSDKGAKGKTVSVPEELYKILEKCGLPCEKIRVSSGGGYYGSSGRGYRESKVSYKEVRNEELEQRVKKVLDKYNSSSKFSIAIPLEDEFEIAVGVEGIDREMVINSDLDNVSDKDLESTILIGILHEHDSNMYSLLKRLIKIVLRSPHFRKILFNK